MNHISKATSERVQELCQEVEIHTAFHDKAAAEAAMRELIQVAGGNASCPYPGARG
ncbi:predicted protein [Cyanophage PSS2]|uniref:hypothetical protein n=1 Tax=Cyanophage PSS2 TaxID=658401 RepID=UPI0001B03FFC|nr:hypothetical protein PSS2_gp039 [Cyanophage PSS2]ACT65601.1 hypothetical protein [Cyanophage PSS2]ACY75745.1 predicted protein [Cyanophage PSS2]